MTTHDLTITTQEPKEVILAGRAAAKELTGIVSSRDKKLVLSGKQYLFFEDWQTIGKFYGVTAKVTGTEELKDNGNLVGFLAHAIAVAAGNEISAADGECTRDEPNWREKPRFQLRSMAQTRACAKALRNCLGWVAVLAGYEATPAEEMAGSVRKPTPKTREPAPIKTKSKVADQTESEEQPSVATPPVAEPVVIATEASEIPKTTEELYAWAAKMMNWKDTKPVRSWLVNKVKIEEARIDSDPEGCYHEAKELMGW